MKHGIFENVKGTLMIGGEFAFFMYQTHGIPPEILEDIVNVWLDKGGWDILTDHLKGGK